MKPLRTVTAWGALCVGFVRELALATVDTIRAVMADRGSLRPAILAVPLDVRSDGGIALFADMVTLTPGTTSLEVSEDRKTLFVHALDAPDADAAVANMKSSLEASVRRVLK